MSKNFLQLHSHSGLEKILNFPKHTVLVDEEYKNLFADANINITPFNHRGVTYYKVPTLVFARKGGVFKNFES